MISQSIMDQTLVVPEWFSSWMQAHPFINNTLAGMSLVMLPILAVILRRRLFSILG